MTFRHADDMINAAKILTLSLLFLLGLAYLAPAQAETLIAANAQEIDQSLTANDEIVVADMSDQALAENEMSDTRGAADLTPLSNQMLAATTSGNSFSVAGDLTTGSINLGDALSGLGFGSFVMNTGNNTAINSAVALSVQILSP